MSIYDETFLSEFHKCSIAKFCTWKKTGTYTSIYSSSKYYILINKIIGKIEEVDIEGADENLIFEKVL